MGPATWILIAIVVVLVITALWAVSTYNGLVTLRNRFKNAWSQIDVQLKRRYDLIPNLVETAKTYLAHERGTLEAVIQARNQAVGAQGRAGADPTDAGAVRGLLAAEGVLSGAMGKLFALAEAYPDLKANTTMAQLSEELTTTENKVAFARQAYNDGVMAYNTAREIFPAAIIASLGGFQPAQPYELDNPAHREAPVVKL
jgi:LemA protein